MSEPRTVFSTSLRREKKTGGRAPATTEAALRPPDSIWPRITWIACNCRIADDSTTKGWPPDWQ